MRAVKLTPPIGECATSFTGHPEMLDVLNTWIDVAMCSSDWDERADLLTAVAIDNLDALDGVSHAPELVFISLTAVLEHLGEKEINSAPAAAFYALSLNFDWSEAAGHWMDANDGAVAAWAEDRPAFRRLAAVGFETLGLDRAEEA